MALLEAKQYKGYVATNASSGAGATHVSRYETTTSLATGDIIAMATLPANAQLVDVILGADDLDSNASPAITLNVGQYNNNSGAPDVVSGSTVFTAASTIAQSGGIAHATQFSGAATLFNVSTSNRVVCVKVVSAAATAVAGTIQLVLKYTM